MSKLKVITAPHPSLQEIYEALKLHDTLSYSTFVARLRNSESLSVIINGTSSLLTSSKNSQPRGDLECS